MLVQSIVGRLRACLETREVYGATEFYHVTDQSAFKASPTYYVVPNTEAAQGVDGLSEFRAINQIRIIVMVETNPQDHRAEKAFFDARVERDNLFKCVLGWCPDGSYYPTEYVGGALLQAFGARTFYAYTFNFPERLDPAEFRQIQSEPMKLRLQMKDNKKC